MDKWDKGGDDNDYEDNADNNYDKTHDNILQIVYKTNSA